MKFVVVTRGLFAAAKCELNVTLCNLRLMFRNCLNLFNFKRTDLVLFALLFLEYFYSFRYLKMTDLTFGISM